MRLYIKNIIFIITLISSIYGVSKTTINIWHQMLYENRKALQEVCDDYEKNNSDIKINLKGKTTSQSILKVSSKHPKHILKNIAKTQPS